MNHKHEIESHTQLSEGSMKQSPIKKRSLAAVMAVAVLVLSATSVQAIEISSG